MVKARSVNVKKTTTIMYSKISHFKVPATHKYSVALNTIRLRRARKVMALSGVSYSDTAKLLFEKLSFQSSRNAQILCSSQYDKAKEGKEGHGPIRSIVQ